MWEDVLMTSAPRPSGPRALARERTMARIVELGNAQLVEQGVAGLSVREIARGLGMVSSAIYRYVSSRDELLTLLIVDAFAELADAVDAAVETAVETAAETPGGGPRARFLALGDAMCAWAIAHPERWALLYGTPVRDYSAPAETTNVDGTRVMRAVLRIAAAAAAQGGGPAAAAGAGAVPEGAAPRRARPEQACGAARRGRRRRAGGRPGRGDRRGAGPGGHRPARGAPGRVRHRRGPDHRARGADRVERPRRGDQRARVRPARARCGGDRG